jgi:iron complex transport system ATP-binding protein
MLEAHALGLTAGGSARGRRLLEGLDFRVEPGQRWVVLGPNGAGKSSLLAALAGVFPVSGGELRLEGRAAADWSLAELARHRAWCPQFWIDPFPATVAETVGLARAGSAWWHSDPSAGDEAELASLLAALDLTRFARNDVRTLSGGERQRVAVATALWQGTPLLLLDEPASHLDLAHQQMLVALLHGEARRGRAVVASLHDLNLAWDLASHAILIDGRGGVCCGPRDEVMQPRHLAAVYGVAIDQVEVCGQRRFWVGPLPPAPG